MVSPHGPWKHKVEALHIRGLDPCLDPPPNHAPHQATPHTTNKSTRSTSKHHDTSTSHQSDDDAGNNKGTPTDTHPCNNGHYPCDPTTTLKLATQNVQKTGKDSPSGTNIKALIADESPDILFITETPYDKDCPPLCSMLSNAGYYIHFRPTRDPVHPENTPQEAQIPAASTGTTGGRAGGCMLAFIKKKQPYMVPRRLSRTATIPPEFSPGIACALEITITRRRNKCLMLCCYLSTPRQRPPRTHMPPPLGRTPNTLPRPCHHPWRGPTILQGNWTDTGR